MSKLLMLSGLPASGKSTYAKELLSSGGNWYRVNRDLLRTMLHNNKFTHNNEAVTIEAEKLLADSFLRAGYNVVVDDTNLGDKHRNMWHEVAKLAGVTFEVRAFDTGVDECIERDAKRDKTIGADVIINMALQYGKLGIDKPVVLCDIDGTIANIEHRLHHVHKEPKDWKKFFDSMKEDSVRTEVLDMLHKEEEQGKQVIFVSARPEDYRGLTEDWLRANVPLKSPLIVLMRPSGDKRDDTIVKNNIYDKYLSNLKIDTVYDDRPKVIRMWQSLNLNVVDVGNGIEF